MNARKLLLPLAILVLGVTVMFAYYDLYRRTAERIAGLDTSLSTVDGLAEVGIALPRVAGAVASDNAALGVRVVIANDLLVVDGVGPLLAKMERTGTAIKPRDSRNFVVRTEGDAWTSEMLVSQIAWQFANIDSLRLVARDAPPLRTLTLVVADDVPRARFDEALAAARTAGAAEILVAVESEGGVGHVVGADAAAAAALSATPDE